MDRFSLHPLTSFSVRTLQDDRLRCLLAASTCLFCGVFLMTGTFYILHTQTMVTKFHEIGFPLYILNPSTNDETFNDFNPANWDKIVHDLDAVMRSLEDLVAKSDDATLLQIAPTVERISTDTAYHTGRSSTSGNCKEVGSKTMTSGEQTDFAPNF